MTKKTSPARRAAFLSALKATGNQTLAAERAKVSRSWVRLHRSTDPEFAAAVREAVAAAREKLRTGPHPNPLPRAGEGEKSSKPPSGWGSLDGEELVVRGTNGVRLQIARARLRQWTPRSEARFLHTLAATCNVKAACAEVGLTPASAYNHRRRWRRFAELWDEALKTGAARIELALVENANNLFSPPECPPEAAMPGMNVAQAIHILHMHKHRLHGIGGRPGRRPRPPSLNDPGIRQSILRVLEAVANGQQVSAAERAADERAYAARRWREGEEGPSRE